MKSPMVHAPVKGLGISTPATEKARRVAEHGLAVAEALEAGGNVSAREIASLKADALTSAAEAYKSQRERIAREEVRVALCPLDVNQQTMDGAKTSQTGVAATKAAKGSMSARMPIEAGTAGRLIDYWEMRIEELRSLAIARGIKKSGESWKDCGMANRATIIAALRRYDETMKSQSTSGGKPATTGVARHSSASTHDTALTATALVSKPLSAAKPKPARGRPLRAGDSPLLLKLKGIRLGSTPGTKGKRLIARVETKQQNHRAAAALVDAKASAAAKPADANSSAETPTDSFTENDATVGANIAQIAPSASAAGSNHSSPSGSSSKKRAMPKRGGAMSLRSTEVSASQAVALQKSQPEATTVETPEPPTPIRLELLSEADDLLFAESPAQATTKAIDRMVGSLDERIQAVQPDDAQDSVRASLAFLSGSPEGEPPLSSLSTSPTELHIAGLSPPGTCGADSNLPSAQAHSSRLVQMAQKPKASFPLVLGTPEQSAPTIALSAAVDVSAINLEAPTEAPPAEGENTHAPDMPLVLGMPEQSTPNIAPSAAIEMSSINLKAPTEAPAAEGENTRVPDSESTAAGATAKGEAASAPVGLGVHAANKSEGGEAEPRLKDGERAQAGKKALGGGRKLIAKSKPFWKLKMEKKAVKKPAPRATAMYTSGVHDPLMRSHHE